jgi:subtilisin family serine protease
MKRKPVKFLLVILTFNLLFSSILLGQAVTVTSCLEQDGNQTSIIADNSSAFKPNMTKPAWVDKNNNCIADALDNEITSRILNNTAGDYVSVTVALKAQPTTDDANAFVLSGGYLTTSPWTYALYGFGGKIPYSQIANFAQLDPNVLLVEKEQVAHAQVAYAAQQIGARTYVWNTLGLKGDPQSSIAIVDTGIDASHSDFSPGFGSGNFSKKIVAWNNQINGITTPFDDNGHGSHVSGLAAGDGFFSTDASGYATATWGANLGAVPYPGGTYLISGMMVNKTGTITIKAKWATTGTATLSALPLYYGDKALSTSSWAQVTSKSTPRQNTWYTLTYNVPSTPTGGYDMYHVTMSLTAGSGDLYVVFTMSWPYTPPADGFNAWTGIAPQTKLVGVKALDYSGSGTDAGLLNAIDWIIANRQAYHIVITSMSLGFGSEVSTVDQAVVNLVNSGVTTVVAAGNNGTGGNYIYTPGSVDEVITVASENQFDNIASYSSQGGASRYTGKTTKPDIAAPGGSFFAVPLFSADSNTNDAEGQWSDTQPNDSAPMQGTSMATPVVSGAASIIIQAMGGFANWQYTRNQALLPKMILLMTATENYPNLREYYTSNSPTLERGGKDVHEGYGRVNLDAAADAVLKTYRIGTTVNERLGRPPTLADISVLGQKLAWARKVQLNTEGKYNFTLTVPTGADFDLYLYDGTGTSYGEPAIVAKSTNVTTGGREQIILTAPYNGTYYLVVKRATEATQGGAFILESAFTPKHNVAVVSVEPSGTSAYVGNKLNVTVTVKNTGQNTESFNVTAFYNNTIIGRQETSLIAGAINPLTFAWNTSGITPSHYTVKAEASIVPNEYNVTDNTFQYSGTVYVKTPGDVNSDGMVNAVDLLDVSNAYGSMPTLANWNPECDFNRDNTVSVSDLATLSRNYGKTV